jgi:hypothetical protein
MIIGGFAAGVRILLEKGPSRHHIWEDQEIPEKYQKIIFYQKTEEDRRRRREEPQGRHTHRGAAEIDTATSAGQKTPEREKLSGRQKFAGKIPSQRGEIVAIVIIITPDFIGIIITIILTTITFIFTITMPSRYNILS